MANSSRRERIDPIWWAPVLVLVIAAITALTALLFSGTLRKTVPLTLVSDRAGLVMEDGAKVKLRGVQSLALDPSTLAVTDFASTVFVYDREFESN